MRWHCRVVVAGGRCLRWLSAPAAAGARHTRGSAVHVEDGRATQQAFHAGRKSHWLACTILTAVSRWTCTRWLCHWLSSSICSERKTVGDLILIHTKFYRGKRTVSATLHGCWHSWRWHRTMNAVLLLYCTMVATSRTGSRWPVSSKYVTPWLILPRQTNVSAKSAAALKVPLPWLHARQNCTKHDFGSSC